MLAPDGFLVTSAHVVEGSAPGGVASFVDGRELAFTVVGSDALSDLAVLRAEGRDLVPASGWRSRSTCTRAGSSPR